MTVPAQTPINRHLGNGVTTVFPFNFKVLQASDLEVSISGAIQSTGFTVSGVGANAGDVTFAVPPAAGSVVVLRRSMTIQRTTDYQNQGAMPAETVDDDHDATVMMVQQVAAVQSSALQFPVSESTEGLLPAATGRANRVLAFDADGAPVPSAFNVDQVASAISAAYLGGAATSLDAVAFIQSGTGAVARSSQRKLRESVSVLDFIPESEHAAIFAGTSTYDCHAAIMAAVNSVAAGTGWYRGGPSVYFPEGGTYKVNQTIELKNTVRLHSGGSGLPGGWGAKLVFPPGVTGIIVHRYNTTGATVESTPTTAADGSTIEGLQIEATAVGTPDAFGGHGIWLRARAVVRNCIFRAFSGNGVHIVAAAGGPPEGEGNANNWRVDTVRVQNCAGHGVYVDGPDVNAGIGIGIDASSNGRCGIYDSSFLGNTWVGCHTDANGCANVGANGANKSSVVSYGGNRYFAHWNATEAQLVATVPGTNANVWVLLRAGGAISTIPTWVAGQPEGTYFKAFAYLADSAAGVSTFIGCYSESGYAEAVFNGLHIIAGFLGNVHSGDYLRKSVNGNTVVNSLVAQEPGSATFTKIAGDKANGDVLEWYTQGETGAWTWRFRYANGDYQFINANSGTRIAARLTGELTTVQAGRGVAQPYKFAFSDVILGPGLGARTVTYGSAAPTSGGPYAQGDIVFNNAPTAGGFVGWVCTATGSPGTWKTFGAVSA